MFGLYCIGSVSFNQQVWHLFCWICSRLCHDNRLFSQTNTRALWELIKRCVWLKETSRAMFFFLVFFFKQQQKKSVARGVKEESERLKMCANWNMEQLKRWKVWLKWIDWGDLIKRRDFFSLLTAQSCYHLKEGLRDEKGFKKNY